MEPNRSDSEGNGEMVRSLFMLLILAGIVLGVLLSMEVRGRQRRAGLLADNHDLQTQLAFIEAKHGEVLNFLGRPQTELVKLTGTGDWTGQAMTIAWNPTQRMAMVLIDRLPPPADGTTYHLRAISAGDKSVTLGDLDPQSPPHRTYAVPPDIADPFRFEVTLDPTGDHPGRVVFRPARV